MNEHEIRELLGDVRAGRLSRRAFVRAMVRWTRSVAHPGGDSRPALGSCVAMGLVSPYYR
jgi:hypothetical protein